MQLAFQAFRGSNLSVIQHVEPIKRKDSFIVCFFFHKATTECCHFPFLQPRRILLCPFPRKWHGALTTEPREDSSCRTVIIPLPFSFPVLLLGCGVNIVASLGRDVSVGSRGFRQGKDTNHIWKTPEIA